MVVDLFLVYSFIKRLVTPFEKWEAYKLGIIDEKGNILIKRKNLNTIDQRKAFGVFDHMILNLKKLLAKLPGGSSRLATYAAALWLIKESENYKEKNGVLMEDVDLNENYLDESSQRFVEEFADFLAEAEKKEMIGVGSGAIAGLGVGPQGEPGVSKAAQIKHKKKNKQLLQDVKEQDMKSFNQYINNLAEAQFRPGNLRLKSGETVKLSREDAKALADMLKDVEAKNRKKMEMDLMKDKKGFEEILKFAKEVA